jgi:hypothetical protein
MPEKYVSDWRIMVQYPNSKHQIPNNDQISMTKSFIFEHWKIGIYLGFVIWDLEFERRIEED